jgi:dTDP-4-dehydrorhamnose reductase
MTLRTSFVGPEKETKRSLLEWAFSMSGKEVKGFTNHKWNGLSTIYFAEAAEKIYKENIYKEGVYHVYSPDAVTKFELVNIFNDVFSLGMQVEPAEAKESCDRSLSSVYDISSRICTKQISEQVKELQTFFKL